MPPHLERSINLAYLEICTYDQIVAHLEAQLERLGLEEDGGFHISTMTVALRRNNENKTNPSEISWLYSRKLSQLIKD